MTAVTVDVEDLEALVMATGAIKAIEGALNARKTDPFVRPHLELTDVHNRLASAMRNAKRAAAGTVINFDEPLTEEELKALKKLDRELEELKQPYAFLAAQYKAPKPGQKMSIWDQLMCKGCIVIGQLVKGSLWSGEERPELSLDPSGFAVKITDRGYQKLSAT